MEIITKILVTLIGLGSAILMLRYARQVVQFTGKFGWAEQYLGHGGTYLVIRLFAALLVFVFLLYPFGYWDAWLKNGQTMGGTKTIEVAPGK